MESRKNNLGIDKAVRISNFLRINSEKMFADVLNPIIATTKKYERKLKIRNFK